MGARLPRNRFCKKSLTTKSPIESRFLPFSFFVCYVRLFLADTMSITMCTRLKNEISWPSLKSRN